MYTREWLVESAQYYRQLNFFEEYSHLSDDELADQLILLREQETGGMCELFHNRDDWVIVELDKKRALSAATDILYAEEPPGYDFQGYVTTLQNLAAISRSIFLPQGITEASIGSIESISRSIFLPQDITEASIGSIEFILNDKRYTLVPDGPPDDTLILAGQINPMVLETGYQFEQWDLSPGVILVVLNSEEKRRLAEEKGWRFLHDRWMFG